MPPRPNRRWRGHGSYSSRQRRPGRPQPNRTIRGSRAGYWLWSRPGLRRVCAAGS
ncbi:MAG: phage DNA packaging protein J [Candidatus Aminicenantes bacterium]|nr:phage DNA packaging protein J [Candidatus Aminicenantes bacterium]